MITSSVNGGGISNSASSTSSSSSTSAGTLNERFGSGFFGLGPAAFGFQGAASEPVQRQYPNPGNPLGYYPGNPIGSIIGGTIGSAIGGALTGGRPPYPAYPQQPTYPGYYPQQPNYQGT